MLKESKSKPTVKSKRMCKICRFMTMPGKQTEIEKTTRWEDQSHQIPASDIHLKERSRYQDRAGQATSENMLRNVLHKLAEWSQILE